MGGPFDDLDREAPAAGGRPRGDPGGFTALLRGARGRCPRCGGGGLFESRFRIRARCPRCNLRLEREEGGFLGAMVVNYGATAAVWVLTLIAWLMVDLPDIQVLRLTLASIGIAVAVPLLLWQASKSLWAAVDYLVYRTDPGYASAHAADRAAGNGGTTRRSA